MVSGGPSWSVLFVPMGLLGLAVTAVVTDGLLSARTAGRRFPGPTKLLPLAEVARLLRTGRRATPAPDRLLWRLGVVTVPVAAVLAVLVVPFGWWVAADLGVGVLWFHAMAVLTWAALWLAGSGPNRVFALVGGYRFVTVGLAYQLPLAFALVSAAAGAQSLRLADIVSAQRQVWFVVWMPVAFVVYLASVLAFSFVGPFDHPTGRDIAGGVLVEAGGVDQLVVRAGQWMLLSAGAAMAVPLYLGGGHGPLLPGWAWSLVKTLAVLAVLVYARRRAPMVRADRYVELAWVVLIPATVAQTLAPALVALS